MGAQRIAAFVERRGGLIVLVLLLIVLSAGALYSAHLGDRLRYFDDERRLTLAGTMAETYGGTSSGEAISAYYAPGYPFLLSLAISLGADVFHMRLLNYLLLCVSAGLMYLLLKRRASIFAGVLGALLVFLYPVTFYAASTFFPQTMGAALFVAILYLYFRDRDPRSRDFVGIGVLFGCLILTIPTFAFTLLVFCAWLLFEKGRKSVRPILIVATAACVLIAPWVVRNYVVFDAFVFVSTNSGKNLLYGNSENTTLNSGNQVDISRYTPDARLPDEVEVDRYFRGKAIEFIREDPARAARLYVLKFVNYFNYRGELATKAESSGARWALILITYGPLLLIGLPLRAFLVRKIPLSRLELFSIVLYVLNGAFAAIFFTKIRFRMPFDYLLIAVVATLLGSAVSRWHRKNPTNVRGLFLHKSGPVAGLPSKS